MRTGKRVIVLDDDTSILGALKRVLKVHGFEAETFDAVDMFHASAPLSDALCLVLDINLNGTSGIDVRRQLTRSGVSIPVIFMTGSHNEATHQAAQEAGCVAYLQKPFSSAALIDAIEQVR
jgi:FixJ family two-component response regulator